MTERDDRSIDHELSGIAMAALFEHEQTVSPREADAALDAVRSRVAGGDLGGAPPSLPLAQSAASRHSPWVRFGAVAAALAMLALGLVAVVGGDRSNQVANPVTLPTTPSSAGEPASTQAAATETDSDVIASTTTSTIVVETVASATTEFVGQTISVDAASPPVLIEPRSRVALGIQDNGGDPGVSVAVGPGDAAGEVNIVVKQKGDGFVTVVPWRGPGETGLVRNVEISEDISSIVAGPGSVVYGIGEPVFDEGNEAVPRGFRFVAIPFEGALSGEVVAVEEVGLNEYLELPPFFFGHGAGGIIDRGRQAGETVIGYVDENGDPIDAVESFPFPTFSDIDGDGFPEPGSGIVELQGSGVSWQLEIQRDPNHGGSYVGVSPPAPTSGGRAIYFERIGANLTSDQDFGPNATPVIALLNADGSGRWIRLPDGWDVVASDVWGTVLMRRTDTDLEFALLDDALESVTGEDAPLEPDDRPLGPTDDLAAPETTVPGGLNGLVQPTAIARNCAAGDGCTQLASTENGRIVSYDPSDNTLRVFNTAGTELQADVPVAESVASPFLWGVGPDDVAYLQTFEPDAGESGSELLAIPLVGSNAGTVVMRWTGLGTSGDSTLVPRKSGLTVVGCCGQRLPRPAPDAFIYRWVDRNGEVIESTAPSFDLTLGDSGSSITRVDTAGDGSPTFTRFSLPTAFQSPRDFPQVIATDDGGALAYDVAQIRAGQLPVIVDLDTDWPDFGIDNIDVYYGRPDLAVPLALLEPAGSVIVVGGAGFERQTLDQVGDHGWGREITIERTAEVWAIDAAGLNAYVEEQQPVWATDPSAFAMQFKQFVGPNERVEITYDETSTSIAIITTGLLDDSVAAERLSIDVEVAADGLFRFVSGSAAFACQPGRGHQEFSIELCT